MYYLADANGADVTGATIGVLLFVIVLWVLPIFIGHRLGKNRGRATAGTWLGILLGWLGVIITACLSDIRNQQFVAQQQAMAYQQWQQQMGQHPYPPGNPPQQ